MREKEGRRAISSDQSGEKQTNYSSMWQFAGNKKDFKTKAEIGEKVVKTNEIGGNE